MDKKKMNQMLIEQLLAIPFPYSDILRVQVSAAALTTKEYSGYYCIHFEKIDKTICLPSWLDKMPLSWQIPTDDIPYLCQLFVKDGYIDMLEIIDMGFNEIKWEYVWTALPVFDYEFDEQNIYKHLTSKELFIEKILLCDDCIDLLIVVDDISLIASFRGCVVRRLASDNFPRACQIKFEQIYNTDYRYLVHTDDDVIDFDCAMVFLQYRSTF